MEWLNGEYLRHPLLFPISKWPPKLLHYYLLFARFYSGVFFSVISFECFHGQTDDNLTLEKIFLFFLSREQMECVAATCVRAFDVDGRRGGAPFKRAFRTRNVHFSAIEPFSDW